MRKENICSLFILYKNSGPGVFSIFVYKILIRDDVNNSGNMFLIMIK